MDKELKNLLVEVARAVLRALDPQDKTAEVRPASTTAPTPAPAPSPTPVVRVPQNGDAVRIWTGDRYETGIVKTVCRGTPRRIWVTVSKGEGKRARKFRVESDKAVIVKEG
jgi:hypothetical protein